MLPVSAASGEVPFVSQGPLCCRPRREWLCPEILHAYGLPVARTQALQFEDMKVLAVERFDRRWWTDPDGKSWLIRLPQEDMCQATATPPHLK